MSTKSIVSIATNEAATSMETFSASGIPMTRPRRTPEANTIRNHRAARMRTDRNAEESSSEQREGREGGEQGECE